MRLGTAATWPVGIAVTSWNYLWRTTPLHRRELIGDRRRDAPPPLPEGISTSGLQLDDRGVGALFHRRYRARILGATVTPEQLLDDIAQDPNRVAPRGLARFKKRGVDEFLIRMPGPWDGPVRVVHRTPTSMRLATLETHLEAGQIEFRAEQHGEELVLIIESWARSGDRLSNLLHQRLRMAKEVQLHMWTSFLERAAKRAGGRLRHGIDVETRVVEVDDADTKGLLDELHGKALNFAVGDRRGWRVDHYSQPLAPCSFERAKALMEDYAFADPAVVRAVYRPEDPLDGRDMLLEVNWHGLRFRFGVRVGGVVDETRNVRPVSRCIR